VLRNHEQDHLAEFGGEARKVVAPSRVPHYEAEFYADEFIADPFPHYAAMRALGPVVFLPALGNFAVTRYQEVRDALRDFEVFSSAQGVAADQAGCDFLRGNTLNSDPPVHSVMRAAVVAPLLPGALDAIRDRIEEEARNLVERLLQKNEFDGMADLARHLPLSIVTELVGLAEGGRENMLQWAAGSFDILGIQNERGRRGLETIKEMRRYITSEGIPEKLKPGSWTARLHELADRGQISREMVPLLFREYIGPSLDTTISATGQLFYQLGRNPAQWDLIRRDPSLIPGAVNEAVRLGSPIRSFSRTLTRDFEIGGAALQAGARVMVLFASANRDERRFPDPDRFNPTRSGALHVGFGHGIHQCVGMHLARLEMESLLKAMVDRVAAFVVGEPQVAMNNTIYGFAAMPMRLVAGGPVRVREQALARAALTPPRPALAPPTWRDVRIADRRVQADGVVSFDLVAADDAGLPPFEAGAHIDVEVSPGLVRQYSVCNAPSESSRRYRIAVLRGATSRGGSQAIHDAWRAHQIVRISAPRNSFQLDQASRRTVLVAGGIGVIPIAISLDLTLPVFAAQFGLHITPRAGVSSYGNWYHSPALDGLSVTRTWSRLRPASLRQDGRKGCLQR